MLEAGDRAPAFTLKDHDGEKVALTKLKGSWVVLYFYPRDDTPGCTTEACEFTDSIADFEGMDAVVLGCSPDTPESHAKFRAKHELAARGESHSARGGTAHAATFVAGSRRIHRFACDPAPRSRHDQHRPARKHFHHRLLAVTLLSDPDREVMEKYGAWGEKTLYGKKTTGVIRSTVIIDPKGKLAHRWKSVRAKGHAAKVAEKLAELRAG